MDHSGLGELRGISTQTNLRPNRGLTTWSDVIRALFRAASDALKSAAREVGSV